MIVVSDTSPISALLQINQLEIFAFLFEEIYVPPAVSKELTKLADFGHDLSHLLEADWLKVQTPKDQQQIASFQNRLDQGESEAIVLAKELDASFLLIDERQGYLIAEEEGLRPIGLLGVLLEAKRQNYISSVKEIILELQEKAGFWISKSVFEEVLKLANE